MTLWPTHSRLLAFGLIGGAAFATFAGFGGCVAAESPGADPGAGLAGETCEGCPCTNEDESECRTVLDHSEDYTLCSVGKTKCVAGRWGACVGNRQLLRSRTMTLQASGLHLNALAADAGSCANPCSPGCQQFADNGQDLDAGSTGLTLVEGGGVSLLGSAYGTCYGLACAVVACDSGTTTVTGRVMDPGGNVGLPNVYVYIPNGPISNFAPGVTADQCGGGGTLSGDPLPIPVQTDYRGQFVLGDVPVGTSIPLVVQVGRWRKVITIPNVPACATTALGNIKLPTKQNEQSVYDTIPQMAVQAGGCEALECLLKRMGIDNTEFTAPTGAGRVHYYRTNLSSPLAAGPTPFYDTLVGDLNQLKKYDLVFLSCDCGNEWNGADGAGMNSSHTGANNHTDRVLHNVSTTVTYSQAHANLRSYMALGGRMYTTDFGREWIDSNPSPAFPGVATWDPYAAEYVPGLQVTPVTSFPKGALFGQWMTYHGMTTPFSPGVPFANVVAVTPPTVNWLVNTTNANRSYHVAKTEHTNITFDTPLPGPDGGAPPGGFVGKVAYADMHVEQRLSGSFPNCRNTAFNRDEAALEYLIFDLSSCVNASTGSGGVLFPAPATYTRVYSAACPAGKQVKWRTFNWRGETPSTSSVSFQVGTATTALGLGSATFVPLITPPWNSPTPVVAPNWVSANITTALNTIPSVSKDFLAVKITLNPSSDGLAAPTLYAWTQDFDCIDVF